MRILVTEKLNASGLDVLAGFADVDVKSGLSPEELASVVDGYDALVIRSRTNVDASIIQAGKSLKVIGRAGVGVDNIDVEAATLRGITVVNAPTGNSNAVAEQTLALMLALARNICPAVTSLKAGRWEKSSLEGTEVKGKTLGLVGLGRIARLVAAKARALEMKVIAFDPFVAPEKAESMNVRMMDLNELMQEADYISVHTPLTPDTAGMISTAELALMKPTAYVINCARGGIIDEKALYEALSNHVIAGAALDVYEKEPAVGNPLIDLPNVLCTPHLAASTAEAQENVARDVAQAVVDVLDGRIPESPVNMPYLPPGVMEQLVPYIDLAERLGAFFMQWRGDLLNRLELTFTGKLADYDTRILTSAFLVGLLRNVSADDINLINAMVIARERGLSISQVRGGDFEPFGTCIRAQFPEASEISNISGAMMSGEPHLIELDGQRLNCLAQGQMLVDLHYDRPGIVGRMGQILGQANVNISFAQMSRSQKGGGAIMILGLDERVPDGLLPEFLQVPNVQRVRAVTLPAYEGYML